VGGQTAQERAESSWLSQADAASSVMIQIPGACPSIRALLPVRLTGGYTVTYGVWMGCGPKTCSVPSASGGSPITWTSA